MLPMLFLALPTIGSISFWPHYSPLLVTSLMLVYELSRRALKRRERSSKPAVRELQPSKAAYKTREIA